MDEHPLETSTAGKLLLLTCKIVTPMMLVTLLLATPAFVKREPLGQSAVWDWALRLIITALLARGYWTLPDLAVHLGARRAWDTRLWEQLSAYERGRMFQPVYFALAGVWSVAAALLVRWALGAFLPGPGWLQWLLAALLGLQVGVMYALQYGWFERAAFQGETPRAARPLQSAPGARSNLVVPRRGSAGSGRYRDPRRDVPPGE